MRCYNSAFTLSLFSAFFSGSIHVYTTLMYMHYKSVFARNRKPVCMTNDCKNLNWHVVKKLSVTTLLQHVVTIHDTLLGFLGA